MDTPQPLADRIPVLMYHRVGDARDEGERRYCVSPQRFANHMRALAERGMQACTIDDFDAWLQQGKGLPKGAFLLTFDDGFMGVFEHAFPVLRELGWPATVFLVSTLLGGRDVWRRGTSENQVESYPLLGRAEIDAMREAGISFHAHSRTHPDLTQLGDEALEEEIAGCKADLEALLGEPVRYMAYPYGRYDERVLRMARSAGFRAAFCVESGFNRPSTDAYRVRRLDVFGTDTPAQLVRKVILGTNDAMWSQSVRYYVGRLRSKLRIRARTG